MTFLPSAPFLDRLFALPIPHFDRRLIYAHVYTSGFIHDTTSTLLVGMYPLPSSWRRSPCTHFPHSPDTTFFIKGFASPLVLHPLTLIPVLGGASNIPPKLVYANGALSVGAMREKPYFACAGLNDLHALEFARRGLVKVLPFTKGHSLTMMRAIPTCSALIKPRLTVPFFPPIANEDWICFIGPGIRSNSCADHHSYTPA
jgi:hypothetical protein